MAQLEVVISPDGTVKVVGEDPGTDALRRSLKGLGDVVEKHVGARHVHIEAEQGQQQKAGQE